MTTKTCSRCKELKPLDLFNKRTASKDGLTPLCRACQNKRDLDRYRRAPQKAIVQVRSRTVRNQEFVSKVKTDSGCADCGLQDARGWMFDLDHRHGKVEDVSRMLSHSPARIEAEIAKCDVVCSNCHRLRTYKRKQGTVDAVPPQKARKTPVLMRMWAKLLEFKSSPCVDCKNTFHFAAMDCDHRDPTSKSGDPSNMARNGSESALIDELAKCDVVCSNCHRVRTHSPSQGHRELENYCVSLGVSTPLRLACMSIREEAVGHWTQAKLYREQNLPFLAIFEDEWKNKRFLVEAMVRHRLGIFGTRLRASKLELRRLDKNSDFQEFFERNHLDGHAQASYAYGLFHENKLICCASVRTNHQGERELARLATDYDYHVYGGAGRLIKAIMGEETTLVTFSNNRLSHGKTYEKLGFRLLQENKPSYWYTDGKERIWRYRCRRINDPEILALYPDVEHSEKAQAQAGLFSLKIWGDRRPLFKIEDYGHRKWVLDKSGSLVV